MLKDVIKVDKKHMLKIGLQRKDVQLEETRMIKSKFDVEVNALVKRPNIQRKLNDKEFLTLKVHFLAVGSLLKSLWLYHKRIYLEKEMSKGVLTSNEMLQLLKEVYVTDHEFIMSSHKYNRKSTFDRCPLITNNILPWASKKKVIVTLPSDEVELGTIGRNGKQILWIKQIMKEYNVGQDDTSLV